MILSRWFTDWLFIGNNIQSNNDLVTEKSGKILLYFIKNLCKHTFKYWTWYMDFL